MSSGQLSISFNVPTTMPLQSFFDALGLEVRAFLEREVEVDPPTFSLHSDANEHFFRQPELAPYLAVMEGHPLRFTMEFARSRGATHPVQHVEVTCTRFTNSPTIQLQISLKGAPISDVAVFRDAARSHFAKVIEKATGVGATVGPETVHAAGQSATGGASVAASVIDRLDQAPRAGVPRIPRVFVSYTHDSAEHKNWVAKLARRLNSLAIWLLFDQWDVELGGDLPQFMETGITDSDRILVICTASYNEKANHGRGGAGYEKMIMTAGLMQDQTGARIVPVVRGEHTPPTPTFLSSRRYIDFTSDDVFEEALDELSRALLSPGSQRPLLGA